MRKQTLFRFSGPEDAVRSVLEEQRDHTNLTYETSRGEQARLHEELAQRERALRETHIKSIHEVEELKRAQELRVDEFSVQELRESLATFQELTLQIQKLQERMNCMICSGKFSHLPSQVAVVPSPCGLLSRDQTLRPDT